MDKRRKLLLIPIVLLLLVAAACGCHFWRAFHAREQEQQVFETLEDDTVLPEPSGAPEQEGREGLQHEIMLHDNTALSSSNDDYVGWLTIPDTVISYPIMCSPLEPERYLHLDFYRQYSYSGTPFLDSRCDPNEGNLIIYGHNMINGTMFGSLKNYRNAEFLSKHKTVYLELADGVHVFEVFSAVSVEKTDPWYAFLHALEAGEESAWVNELEGKRGTHSGAVPIGTERLLTLSTCTGNRRAERLIVVAKEVEVIP